MTLVCKLLNGKYFFSLGANVIHHIGIKCHGLSFQESGNCDIWSWWCIANIDCAGIWSGFDILWCKVYSIIISELSGIILGIDTFPGNYEDFKLNDRVFKFVKVQYFCMSLHISVLLKTFVAHSLKKKIQTNKNQAPAW